MVFLNYQNLSGLTTIPELIEKKIAGLKAVCYKW